jgi:hypothetical protein
MPAHSKPATLTGRIGDGVETVRGWVVTALAALAAPVRATPGPRTVEGAADFPEAKDADDAD